jgi:hypothetical protein
VFKQRTICVIWGGPLPFGRADLHHRKERERETLTVEQERTRDLYTTGRGGVIKMLTTCTHYPGLNTLTGPNCAVPCPTRPAIKSFVFIIKVPPSTAFNYSHRGHYKGNSKHRIPLTPVFNLISLPCLPSYGPIINTPYFFFFLIPTIKNEFILIFYTVKGIWV